MGKRRAGVVVLAAAIAVLAIAGSAGTHHQQQHPAAPPPAAPPSQSTATPDDVRSMDSIIAALYNVISGPAGQQRDWNRLRSLCVPNARLLTVGHRPNGDVVVQQFTIDEYVARATPLFEHEGFYEGEISRRADVYNHIAQVFSTYASRHAPNEKPFQRGINSIQLLNDGNRWWIVTVLWEHEMPGHPLPRKYLH